MGFPPVVMGLIVFLLLSRSGPLGNLNLLYTPTAMIIAQLLFAIPIITGQMVKDGLPVTKNGTVTLFYFPERAFRILSPEEDFEKVFKDGAK